MLTINKWLATLGRTRQGVEDCPVWPPDVFALSASILKRSGAYLHVFHDSASGSDWANAHLPGIAWRKAIDRSMRVSAANLRRLVPREVRDAWTRLLAAGNTGIADIQHAPELAEHLIRLTLIADAASAGIGVTAKATPFLTAAQAFLEGNHLTSFAWDVPRDAICVLGKQHTPNRGATLRSLSHHLALYLPNDIEARWIGPYPRQVAGDDQGTLNLLLLPWPECVDSNDFRPVGGTRTASSDGDARWFEYRPQNSMTVRQFVRRVQLALVAAGRQARRIDAIVFPELSLSIDQYFAAEQIAFEHDLVLVAGVGEPGSARRQGANLCVLQPAGVLAPNRGSKRDRERLIGNLRQIRSKHHRWRLDREQTQSYQLAGQLQALQSPWENIELSPRIMQFVTLDEWMTVSVLICEDLARQDPAADLIRAVGPNLLIALLMDGPQLQGRWPSRYASVLAEDPGTSVLTITSLGMAQRSRPAIQGKGKREKISRSIALWRDVESGEHEIELDEGDNACVLSLVCKSKSEYAADGRGDGEQAHFPIFAGFRSFKVE